MSDANHRLVIGSRRLQGLVSASVVAALVTAAAVWWGWPTYQLSKVDVRWAGIPVCSGTTVQNEYPDDPEAPSDDPLDPERVPVLAVAAHPDMRCLVHIEVANRTGHTITVHKIIAPWLGPGSGGMVKAAPAYSSDILTANPDNDLDADYEVAATLEPETSTHFVIAFVFRNCQEGVAGYPDWPQAQVSLWGRTVVRAAQRELTISGIECAKKQRPN